MTVTYIPLPREDVITYLGMDWPVPTGSTVIRIDPAQGVTDGAVAISTDPRRPGVLWWLIDGTVPPQAAGQPTEELAALIPGSVLEIPEQPNPNPDPPHTVD
ncbi:hypothetical protein RKD45_002510 [Streptomyces griseus]